MIGSFLSRKPLARIYISGLETTAEHFKNVSYRNTY